MRDPRKKEDMLKKSLESGIINRQEYEKEKKKADAEIEEFDKKVEEMNKMHPEEEEPKKFSEKALVIGIAVVILLFAAIFAFTRFNKEEPKTLEELHVLNLKGKLEPEKGYVYKGAYSFVNFEDQWYTQLKSPLGTRVYNMALRYSPKELEGIPIEGSLNSQFFNNQTEYYVTFNPDGKEFTYVALAVADFNAHMLKVFDKLPVASCDRNQTAPCFGRPIVTCEDRDKLVLYVKESGQFRVYYNDNCVVVEGTGINLVRGVDRILYNLYGIMEQEEA